MKLIDKYNVAAPRYTSYPTVPYWDNSPNSEQWKEAVKFSFARSNHSDGISVYIHLPYCESLCTYCGCNTRITVNHAVEAPYIEAVLKEWSLYLEVFEETPNIRELHLGGGTPTFFSPEHLAQLVGGLLESSHLLPGAELGFEAHPANTTDEHMQVLYHLGFRRLSLGIQDFDPKVQEIINRKQTFEDVKRVTESARRIGYTSINFDLIYGLPLQTLTSIIDTIEKVECLRPDRIAYYSYAHVPWIKPGQRKFTEADLPEGEAKRRLYETGRGLLEEAGYCEIGMDHFALPTDSLYQSAQENGLHRNFMGYTTQHTQLLVGLGVSAISDTWYAFAQNKKTVEDYLETVNKGELPVFRGHLLNTEDSILRRHILNLMCRNETSWSEPHEQCEALYGAIERLEELERDGLVEIRPFHAAITPKGRPFLRNACMAFDARLWRKQPEGTIFSTTA